MLFAIRNWQPPSWKGKVTVPSFQDDWKVWQSYLRQHPAHKIQGIIHCNGDVNPEEVKAYLLCKQLAPVHPDGKSPVLERSQWMCCCVALLLNKGTYIKILNQKGILINHFVAAKQPWPASTVNLTVEDVALFFAKNGVHVDEVDNANSYAINWVELAITNGSIDFTLDSPIVQAIHTWTGETLPTSEGTVSSTSDSVPISEEPQSEDVIMVEKSFPGKALTPVPFSIPTEGESITALDWADMKHDLMQDLGENPF